MLEILWQNIFGKGLFVNDDEADEWLIQYGNMTAYYGRLTARAYASDELKNGVRFFDLSLQAAQSNLFYKSGVDSTNEFGSGRAVANRSFGGGLRYGLEMGNGRTGLALGIGVGGLAIYEAEYLYGSLENIQDDVEQTSGYEFNRVAFTIDLYSSINFKYFILTGRALLATNQKGKEDRFGNTPQIGHGFWTFEAGVGIPLFRTYRWKNKR